MLYTMFRLLLNLLILIGAQADCSQHSKFYEEFYGKGIFYLHETAGLLNDPHRSSSDDCEQLTSEQFKSRMISRGINITSEWTTGYIVDGDGPSLTFDCDRNVRGNMIIIRKEWKTDDLCWKNAEIEKRTIFGNQIVNKAMGSVRRCCTKYMFVVVILAIIFALICTGCVLCSIAYIRGDR